MPRPGPRRSRLPRYGRTRAGSVRTPLREDDRNRLAEDLQVPPEGPVRHVEVVELDHLVERDVVAPEHLPEPGDPGSHVEPAARPSRDLIGLIDDERSRPHQAHVTLQY